jgi:hypothetical protein
MSFPCRKGIQGWIKTNYNKDEASSSKEYCA